MKYAHAVTQTQPQAVLVELSGSIDLANLDDVRATLEEAIDLSKDLLVDLRYLDFIGSCGIGLLMRLATTLKENGCALRVVACSPGVARVFAKLRLDFLIPWGDLCLL